MSEQGDKFAAEYLGVRDALSFEASLAYARQAAGSNRGAARLLGLGESTLRGWMTGRRNIAAKSKERVVAAVRDLRTPKQTSDEIKLKVMNTDRKRTRGRHPRQPVSKGSLGLADGTMAAARAVYVATGSADKAYARFLSGVGDAFYKASLARSAGFKLDDDLAYEGLFADYGMTLI